MDIQLKENDVLTIGIEDHGDKSSKDGEGAVVMIDKDVQGITCVFVWADINQEDPTHKIPLEGALECNRKEE